MKHTTDLLLAFAMTLSTIGCVVAWYDNPAWLLYVTAVPFFCVQLLLCRLSKRWQIRIVPALPVVILAGMALFYLVRDSGWDRLAALLLGLACIAPALGIIVALCVAQKTCIRRDGCV